MGEYQLTSKIIALAAYLLDPAEGTVAHYKSGDRLDNTRANIVVATHKQLPKPGGHGATGEKWIYKVNGKQNRTAPYQVTPFGRHLLYAQTLDEAIVARDAWLAADC